MLFRSSAAGLVVVASAEVALELARDRVTARFGELGGVLRFEVTQPASARVTMARQSHSEAASVATKPPSNSQVRGRSV